MVSSNPISQPNPTPTQPTAWSHSHHTLFSPIPPRAHTDCKHRLSHAEPVRRAYLTHRGTLIRITAFELPRLGLTSHLQGANSHQEPILTKLNSQLAVGCIWAIRIARTYSECARCVGASGVGGHTAMGGGKSAPGFDKIRSTARSFSGSMPTTCAAAACLGVAL